MTSHGTQEIRDYYHDFSLMVGERDWREPNWRHEMLRLHVTEVLGAARDLRILDVGCGAGVMSSFMCRFGSVTGTDFSAPAIRLAAAMEPRAQFFAGSLDTLPAAAPYDVVTLFDVLEHVPPAEYETLFSRIGDLLTPGGWIILSTPHPDFSRRMEAEREDLRQVIDEPVDVDVLLRLAQGIGRQLTHYRTYDVDWDGARQYQFVVLAPPAGVAAKLHRPQRALGLGPRLLAASTTPTRRLRVLGHAARLLRLGRVRAALWVLRRRSGAPV